MNIRLVAMDMDDTFLHSDKSISPKNIQAVKDGAASGIVMVPASGRPFHMIPRELTELNGVRYIITVNGARVRDLRTGKYIYSRLIPYGDTVELVKLIREYGAIPESCLDEVFYVSAADEEKQFSFVAPSLEWFIRSMHTKTPDLMEKLREKAVGAEKLLAMFPDTDRMEAFRQEVETRFGVTVSSSLPGELELTARGVSKGTALLALASALGIERGETMAVGDSENDADMLKAAGFAVAMGNAGQELKSIAHAVTGDCDSDGFAQAVYRWALHN